MDRCLTCRYWLAPSSTDAGPGGLCKAVDPRFEGGGPNAHLYTAHDFGCVAHQATVLQPMPGPAECRTCRHFEPNSATAINGECRIARPVVREGLDGTALWPLVLGSDRCGEHARRLVPVEA